ncbi:MAG: CHAT domain-containing protein, partial [Chloroflexota bacterium]
IAVALGAARQTQELAVTILPGRSGLPAATRERLLRADVRIENGPCSLDALRRLLLEHHALHLISHGSYRRGAAVDPGAAALHLEGEDGSWQAIDDERFVAALAAAGVLPHLVFLVACESAKRDEATPHAFVGLGPKLVEAGVPAVVAMQDTVSVRGARQLAGDFWRDLLAHGEVDRAMNAARLLLVDDDGSDWSTPVLFMRLTDGQVFVPHSAATASESAQAASPEAPLEPAAAGGQRDGSPSLILEPAAARATPVREEGAGGALRAGWSNLPGIAKSALGLVTLLIPLLAALVQTGALSFSREQAVSTEPPAPTVAPAVFGATMSDVHFAAPNVALGDAYRVRPRLDPEVDGISPEQLDQPGQLVTYRIDFRGLRGRECAVTWTLFNATTGEPVSNGAWITNDAAAWPDGFWTPEADQDTVQGEVWVPHVAPGEYDVELEVYDDRGILLDLERAKDPDGQPASFVVK